MYYKVAFLLLLIGSLGSATPVREGEASVEEQREGRAEILLFEDEFKTFDLKKWQHDITLGGGGNWEFQLYWNNRTNSYVKDGVLYIKPTLYAETIGENNLRAGFRADFWGNTPADMCTGGKFFGCERVAGNGGNYLNPIQSAKLYTYRSFTFKYGRVEVRAKMPKGDWLWPAIWMLPAEQEYGGWPASGEIDILESRGNLNYPTEHGGGVASFGSALHWGPDWSQNRYSLTNKFYHHMSGTLADDWHIYGLYWDEKGLYTYIDTPDRKVMPVDWSTQSFWEKGKFPESYDNIWKTGTKGAPFDREFYLVINLAVGGTNGYFKDGVAGKPWSNTSPNAVNEFYNNKGQWYPTWKTEECALKIDWVKVWKFV